MPQSRVHPAQYPIIQRMRPADQHAPYPPTERPPPPPSHATSTSSISKEFHSPAAWGIGWQTPALVIGFFLSGVLLIVGHHVYYNSLNGTPVKSATQQTWAIRIGTGLAFLIKALFVAAIGIAVAQQAWSTLRRKGVSLRGIDAMFSVLGNPIAFLVPDMWIGAKTLTLLAIVSW